MKTVQQMLAEADAEVPRISPEDATGLIDRPDVMFLDVREPAEVAASGKVHVALAIPRGLVEFRADPASLLIAMALERWSKFLRSALAAPSWLQVCRALPCLRCAH
jgi:hypothetical protein